MALDRERVRVLDLKSDDNRIILFVQKIVDSSQPDQIKNALCSLLSNMHLVSLSPSQIEIGMFLVACLPDSSGTYSPMRLQVIDKKELSSGYINVLSVDDCKWNMEIATSNLYICPPQIATLPMNCEAVRLADVVAPHMAAWTEHCLSSLKAQLVFKCVEGIMFRGRDQLPFFRPYDPTDSSQFLAISMLHYGMAEIQPSFSGLSDGCFVKSNEKSTLNKNAPNICLPPPITSKAGAQISEVKTPTESPTSRKHKTIIDHDSSCDTSHTPRYVTNAIVPGLSDKCTISSIEKGPWKFCVHLKSQSHFWGPLHDLMNRIVRGKKLTSLSAAVGKGHPVLCRSSKLGEFCRGLIVGAPEEGKVPVFLMDYGSFEHFPLSNLHSVPSELMEIPVLSTRCRLQGLPKSSNSGIIKNFEDLVKNQTLTVTLGRQTSDLITEIYSEIDKFPIVKLISHEVYDSLSIMTDLRVILSHFNRETGIMSLQIADNSELLDKLQAKIQELETAMSIIKEPYQGRPCLALFSEDNQWYRSHVLDCTPNKYKVYFVDYGNTEFTDVIKEIDVSLMCMIAAQAIPCILSGLEEKNIDADFVFEVMDEKEMVVTVTETVETLFNGLKTRIPKVELLDENNGKKINDLLMDHCNSNSVTKTVHFSDAVSIDDSAEVVSEVVIVPDWLKRCTITHINSSRDFFINFVDNKNDLKLIYESLKTVLSSSLGTPVQSFHIGTSVCISDPNSEDPYFRASVLQNLQNALKIKLIDIGREQTVKKSQAYKLPIDVDLKKYAPQAIRCSVGDKVNFSESEEASFKALLKQDVNVHFVSRETNYWKVNILRTDDLIANFQSLPKPTQSALPSPKCESSEPRWEKSKNRWNEERSGSPLGRERSWRENVSSRWNGNSEGRFGKGKGHSVDEPDYMQHDNRFDTRQKSNWRTGSRDVTNDQENWETPSTTDTFSDKKSWKSQKESSNNEDWETPTPASSSDGRKFYNGDRNSWKAKEPLNDGTGNSTSFKKNSYGMDVKPWKQLKEVPVENAAINSVTQEEDWGSDPVGNESSKLSDFPVRQSLEKGEKVFVSFADEGKNRVWLQRNRDSDALETLNNDIDLATRDTVTPKLDPGVVCLCHSMSDDMWYRGAILSSSGDQSLVHYIDYGNTEELPLDRLDSLMPTYDSNVCLFSLNNNEHFLISCLALSPHKQTFIVSSLKELWNQPLDIVNFLGAIKAAWDHHTTTTTTHLLSVLNGKLLTTHPLAYECHLQPSEQAPNLQVFEDEEKIWIVTNIEIGNPPVVSLHCESSFAEDDQETMASAEVCSEGKTPAEQFKTLCQLPEQPPLKEEEQVFVTFVDEQNGCLWLQRNQDSETLENLSDEIDGASRQLVTSIMDAGVLVLSHSLSYDTWYRGAVIRCSADKVLIHYIDYGNTEELPLDRLCELKGKLLTTPPLAYECQLQPSEEVSNLEALVNEEQVLTLTSVEIGKSPKVSLRYDAPFTEDPSLIFEESLASTDADGDNCSSFKEMDSHEMKAITSLEYEQSLPEMVISQNGEKSASLLNELEPQKSEDMELTFIAEVLQSKSCPNEGVNEEILVDIELDHGIFEKENLEGKIHGFEGHQEDIWEDSKVDENYQKMNSEAFEDSPVDKEIEDFERPKEDIWEDSKVEEDDQEMTSKALEDSLVHKDIEDSERPKEDIWEDSKVAEDYQEKTSEAFEDYPVDKEIVDFERPKEDIWDDPKVEEDYQEMTSKAFEDSPVDKDIEDSERPKEDIWEDSKVDEDYQEMTSETFEDSPVDKEMEDIERTKEDIWEDSKVDEDYQEMTSKAFQDYPVDKDIEDSERPKEDIWEDSKVDEDYQEMTSKAFKDSPVDKEIEDFERPKEDIWEDSKVDEDYQEMTSTAFEDSPVDKEIEDFERPKEDIWEDSKVDEDYQEMTSKAFEDYPVDKDIEDSERPKEDIWEDSKVDEDYQEMTSKAFKDSPVDKKIEYFERPKEDIWEDSKVDEDYQEMTSTAFEDSPVDKEIEDFERPKEDIWEDSKVDEDYQEMTSKAFEDYPVDKDIEDSERPKEDIWEDSKVDEDYQEMTSKAFKDSPVDKEIEDFERPKEDIWEDSKVDEDYQEMTSTAFEDSPVDKEIEDFGRPKEDIWEDSKVDEDYQEMTSETFEDSPVDKEIEDFERPKEDIWEDSKVEEDYQEKTSEALEDSPVDKEIDFETDQEIQEATSDAFEASTVDKEIEVVERSEERTCSNIQGYEEGCEGTFEEIQKEDSCEEIQHFGITEEIGVDTSLPHNDIPEDIKDFDGFDEESENGLEQSEEAENCSKNQESQDFDEGSKVDTCQEPEDFRVNEGVCEIQEFEASEEVQYFDRSNDIPDFEGFSEAFEKRSYQENQEPATSHDRENFEGLSSTVGNVSINYEEIDFDEVQKGSLKQEGVTISSRKGSLISSRSEGYENENFEDAKEVFTSSDEDSLKVEEEHSQQFRLTEIEDESKQLDVASSSPKKGKQLDVASSSPKKGKPLDVASSSPKKGKFGRANLQETQVEIPSIHECEDSLSFPAKESDYSEFDVNFKAMKEKAMKEQDIEAQLQYSSIEDHFQKEVQNLPQEIYEFSPSQAFQEQLPVSKDNSESLTNLTGLEPSSLGGHEVSTEQYHQTILGYLKRFPMEEPCTYLSTLLEESSQEASDLPATSSEEYSQEDVITNTTSSFEIREEELKTKYTVEEEGQDQQSEGEELLPEVENQEKIGSPDEEKRGSHDSDDKIDLVFWNRVMNVEESPFSLWLGKDEDCEIFDDIESELLEEKEKGLTVLQKVVLGKVCTSYFCGSLLRAFVLSFNDKTASIRFIDIGKKCCVSRKDLYECPPNIQSIPPLAEQYFLPFHIEDPDLTQAAVTALNGLIFKTLCACVDVTSYLRDTGKARKGRSIVIASENTGSITTFLESRQLGHCFGYKEWEHPDLLNELNATVEIAMKKYLSKIENK